MEQKAGIGAGWSCAYLHCISVLLFYYQLSQALILIRLLKMVFIFKYNYRVKNHTNDWLEALAQHGHRPTKQRSAVVDVMIHSNHALEPMQVFDKCRETLPHLGLVTIYRTLENLENAGLVQKVHHPNGCNMYIRAPQGHQHLLICSHCGKSTYFEGLEIEKSFADIGEQYAYHIQDHWLQLIGLCQECQNKGQNYE